MTREEQEKLYEEHEGLVYAAIQKYYPTWIHDEDVMQSGRIGLWKACTIFDDSKAAFSTLAFECIRREVNKYLISLNKKATVNYWQCLSLDQEYYVDSNKKTIADLYEFIPDSPTVVWIGGKIKDLLSERQYLIMGWLMEGLSSRDIGRRLSLSHQTILDEKYRIIQIIRDNLIDI